MKRFGRTAKWDVNAILDMKGTPQRPDPTQPGLHIPVQIMLEPEAPFSMPAMQPARAEEGPRRPYIMKRHFEEFGYTEECEGCARLSIGMKSKPHSSKCRQRMYDELKRTKKGRKLMEEAETRINEFLEEKVKGDHVEKDKAERLEEPIEGPGVAASSDANPFVTLQCDVVGQKKTSKEGQREVQTTWEKKEKARRPRPARRQLIKARVSVSLEPRRQASGRR